MRLRRTRTEKEGRLAGEAPLRDRLLLLLAVDAASCIAAGTAAGAFHVSRSNLLIALAAGTIAVGATQVFRFPGTAGRANAATQPQFRQSRRILLLVMLVGLVGYVGGSATFAIFSAETANPNGSAGSGTLTLGDKVNTATTCQSYSGATLDNYNYACDSLLTLTNMAPGVASGITTGYAQAKLTIQNGGSIDASKLYVAAPWPSATLSSPLSGTVTSISVSPGFNVQLNTNDTIQVAYGGKSQDFNVTGGPYAAGATSFTVTSVNLGTVTFPVASRVLDKSGNTTPSNTECYDAKTASAPASVPTATYGTQLNFNPATGNPLCQAMLFWIQEQSASGKNYCWYGRGSAASPSPSAVGQCRTPTLATLTSTLSTGGAIATLPVQALTGNVKSGDQIQLTEGTNTQTFCASANSFIGDVSISVNKSLATGETDCATATGGTTPNYAYTAAAVVKDASAFSALDGDTTDTISNFDTGHPQTGIQLYPVNSNNVLDTTAAIELNKSGDSGSQRIFYVGVYMPAPSGTPQNQLQGLVSKFGLTWHIDQ